MTTGEESNRKFLSASNYLGENFEPSDRIAVLLLDRRTGEATQRITSAQKAGSPEFQGWLRYKNVNGADVHVGMNTLKKDASSRTKDDIHMIRHLYIDLDHGGSIALEAIQNSSLVPQPNYLLDTSPGKHQVVWKVEVILLEEAEALQRAMVREFGGDPAATDATRVLRLPGFANKKYLEDFYVRARAESSRTYHLGDFKLGIDSQDAPGRRRAEPARSQSSSRARLSQSEHDWAYANRALARGDDPEEIIRRIVDFRADEKHNPETYARRTVMKAQADHQLRTGNVADEVDPTETAGHIHEK
jgi:DNA primase RepB-like protein